MNRLTKSDKKTNGFVHIFLLIIVVLIGITVFFFMVDPLKIRLGKDSQYDYLLEKIYGPQKSGPPSLPASNPDLSNWETYTNEKYGYSLKHPFDTYRTGSDEQKFIFPSHSYNVPTDFYFAEIRSSNATFRFEKYQNTPDNSLVEEYGDLKLRNFEVQGYNAVEYSYDEKEKQKEREENDKVIMSGGSVGRVYYNKGVLIDNNGIIIEISTNLYYKDFKQVFDQILSTFEFME